MSAPLEPQLPAVTLPARSRTPLSKLAVIVITVFALATPVQAIAPLGWAIIASLTMHGSLLLLRFDGVKPEGSSGGSGAGGTGGTGTGTGGSSPAPMQVNLPPFNKEPVTKPQGWPTPTTPPPATNPPPSPTGGAASYEVPRVLINTSGAPADVSAVNTACDTNGGRKEAVSGGLVYVHAPFGTDPRGSYDNGHFNLVRYCAGGGGMFRLPVKTVCPSGSTESNGKCYTTAAAQVKKPPNTPCEFVFDGGQYKPDPQNPSCDGKRESDPVALNGECNYSVTLEGESKFVCGPYATKFKVEPDAVKVTDSNGNTQTLPTTTLPDGSRALNNPVDPSGGTPSGQTSINGGLVAGGGGIRWDGSGWQPSGGGSGGTGGGSTGGTGGGTTGGNGTGTGTGTGDKSGPLDINDSGFKGLGGNGAFTASSKADQEGLNALNTSVNEKLGFLNSLEAFIPVPRSFAECRPIPFEMLSARFEMNICKYTDVISMAMAYLFYIFTGIYIYRLFTRSSET